MSRLPLSRLKKLSKVLRLAIKSASRSGSRLAMIDSSSEIFSSVSVFTSSAAAMIAATDEVVVDVALGSDVVIAVPSRVVVIVVVGDDIVVEHC